MGDNFKNLLDGFLKNIFMKLNDKSILEELQKEYESLIDSYSKLTVFSKEEFESIESDITSYEETIDKLHKENEELKGTLKTQREITDDKINSLTKTIENLKHFEEENGKILAEYNSILNKSNCCQKENIELNLQIKNLNNSLEETKNENKKLSKENFEKFESLNSLQKENKLQEHTISKLNLKILDLTKINNEFIKKNKEIENASTMSKIFYENQAMTLKKQIEQLAKSNENFINANTELQTKLKDFQTYTNMAKVNTVHLEKKDFSILEAMSQRAQNAEVEYEKIKSINNDLVNKNLELTKKIFPLESLVLLYMKNESEGNRSNKPLTKEEIQEIEEFRKKPNELINLCIKLKNENFKLVQQIQDITVECNQKLRKLGK